MRPPAGHAAASIIDLTHVRDAHLEAAILDAPRTPQALRPEERLDLLCDKGSMQLIRTGVSSERMGEKARAGDGVIGAGGRIGGRPVFCYAQDAGFAAGSVGQAHADTIVRVQRLAGRARVPLIGFIESAGARMQEGLAALDGYARIFAGHVAMAGQIPQISIITGTSAGGGSYSPGLTDFVVMTDAATMFLTGPRVVRGVTGEEVTAPALGGARVHAHNGVSHFNVATDAESVLLVGRLLGYLPQHAGAEVPLTVGAEPEGESPGGVVPLDPRRVYDVRDLARAILDAGSLLEICPSWAPNIVTALARIDGCPVGVVANQPRHLGGVIDIEASQKGARFVRTCDAFGLPLVVLVDTPGFLPGTHQESGGVIRHGASLIQAFAQAKVPRLTVIVRKAFGGAYITMNSKDLGADLVLAWSRAQIGIMGAEQAVGIVHRRRLELADDAAAETRRLSDDYAARHLTAVAAARHGSVDAVIRPDETRSWLTFAIDSLRGGGRVLR